MDFSQELSQFQGALLSADNTYKFLHLSAKGGNENEITGVTKKILKFLEQGGYVSNGQISKDKIPTVRKFSFYLVLNAQLSVLDQMLDLEGIDSVIWTITTVPQCLLCELMWNVYMDQFIHEIISFTHPKLALEVCDAFLDNFKYFDPLECSDRLKLLSSACYTIITRLYLLNSDSDGITKMSAKAINNFQNCLQYFQCPPNEYRLKKLGNDELYEYFGKRLKAMLLMINECVECFTSKLKTDTPGSDVYVLTYKEGSLKQEVPTARICDIEDSILSECLTTCHTAMLDVCKALVMDVSVDVFCTWSEVTENGKTMQQANGELCYKVRQSLLKINTISEHPVISMIEQIARKPDEMADIINATNDDIILEKINDESEDKKIWIQSLIYKEKLCHNLEFLKVISSNLNLFDQEQCHKLYTIFSEYVNLKSQNQTYVEPLLIKVFHQCSLPTKYIILDEQFNNNNFVNMKSMSEFKDSMTQTFNRFIATPDSDLSDVLTLFLQNPQEVFKKIFSLAIENMHQVEVMLKVMKMFEKYCDYYYSSEMEPSIVKITQDVIHMLLDTTSKENNFVNFIRGLKNENILSGTKLLLLIIITNMHQALIAKDIGSINFHIKMIKVVYTLEELLPYRAPMLAMIGKALDVVRWKINTFTANAPPTLTSALDLQKILFDTYGTTISERESDWMKSKVGNLQPLNMYYYRALWHPVGASYLDIISGIVGNNMSKPELASWMSQVISSCTQEEWCEIWNSLNRDDSAKLETYLDAIGMITLAERPNRTDKTAACLLYCYRNFVYIIRYKYFKEPLTDGQVTTVIRHLATIVELSKENLKEFSTFLLPLFAYLSEKQKDYDISYSEYMNRNLKDAALTNLVNKLFSNGAS